MSNALDDLLSCPFCGEVTEQGDAPEYFAKSEPQTYAVECGNPDCRSIGPWAPSTNGAVKGWNTRAMKEGKDA